MFWTGPGGFQTDHRYRWPNIDLEWTTGGSLAQSKQDVDLDLTLLKGSTIVDESFTFSFERV
jgi:hypothetical protein